MSDEDGTVHIQIPVWAKELETFIRGRYTREQRVRMMLFAKELSKNKAERDSLFREYQKKLEIWRKGLEDETVFVGHELDIETFLIDASMLARDMGMVGVEWLQSFLKEVGEIADRTRTARQQLYDARLFAKDVDLVEPQSTEGVLSPEIEAYIDEMLGLRAYDN